MAYVRREYPDKSWSISRRQTLDECARKYYWQYYGSHNGWERDAPPRAQEAYRLKQLTNLYLVLGDALHQAAASALMSYKERNVPPSEQTITQQVRDILNNTYRMSKAEDARQQFQAAPKRYPMLHEMYYGYGPSTDLINKIKERMAVCIANLLRSQSFREACSPAVVEIVKIDQLDSFELDGNKVYAVPDLLYRLENDTWVIVDWKTGTEADEHGDQVRVYALYARNKLQVPLSRLIVRLEYLATGECVEARVTEEELEFTQEAIMSSVRMMDAFLLDPEKNQPRPIDAFPIRDETRLCRFCNFYALCEEEIRSRSVVNA